MSARGFELFRFWYDLYQSAIEDVLPPYEYFTEQAKIQFNTQIKMFKEKFGFTTEDVKHILTFAVYHDPANKGAVYYGKLQNALYTQFKFLSWKRKNWKLIEEKGMDSALLKTAPTIDQKEFAQEVDLSVYFEAYKDINDS